MPAWFIGDDYKFLKNNDYVVMSHSYYCLYRISFKQIKISRPVFHTQSFEEVFFWDWIFEKETNSVHCISKIVCNGGDSCCTTSNQCDIGEGDCDINAECKSGLVCGLQNCIGDTFDANDDCCREREYT